MTAENSDIPAKATTACPVCDHACIPAYRFCPACGLPIRDPRGKPLNRLEADLIQQLTLERTRERRVALLWGSATAKLYLLAILLFTLPDSVLLVICRRYLHRDWNHLVAFLMTDVVTGLLVIFLVRLCAQRGSTGELIIAALRMGQISLVWSLCFMPFEPVHDILNLLLFALLPLVAATIAGLVFRFHLTDLMDLLSSPPVALPPAREAPGAETG